MQSCGYAYMNICTYVWLHDGDNIVDMVSNISLQIKMLTESDWIIGVS